MNHPQPISALTAEQDELVRYWASLPIDHDYPCESARWVLDCADDLARLWDVFLADVAAAE